MSVGYRGQQTFFCKGPDGKPFMALWEKLSHYSVLSLSGTATTDDV